MWYFGSMPDPKPVRRHLYSVHEDEFLCKSWLSGSMVHIGVTKRPRIVGKNPMDFTMNICIQSTPRALRPLSAIDGNTSKTPWTNLSFAMTKCNMYVLLASVLLFGSLLLYYVNDSYLLDVVGWYIVSSTWEIHPCWLIVEAYWRPGLSVPGNDKGNGKSWW